MSPGDVINALGPYPVVQAAVAFAIALMFVGFVAYGLYVAKRRPPDPTPQPMVSAMFMDGPVVEGLRNLERLTIAAEKIALGLQGVAELKEEMGAALQTQRHDLRGEITRAVQAGERDHEILDRRLRETERLAAVVEESIKWLRQLPGAPPPRRGG